MSAIRAWDELKPNDADIELVLQLDVILKVDPLVIIGWYVANCVETLALYVGFIGENDELIETLELKELDAHDELIENVELWIDPIKMLAVLAYEELIELDAKDADNELVEFIDTNDWLDQEELIELMELNGTKFKDEATPANEDEMEYELLIELEAYDADIELNGTNVKYEEVNELDAKDDDIEIKAFWTDPKSKLAVIAYDADATIPDMFPAKTYEELKELDANEEEIELKAFAAIMLYDAVFDVVELLAFVAKKDVFEEFANIDVCASVVFDAYELLMALAARIA